MPRNRGTVGFPGRQYGFNPYNVGALATAVGAGYRYLTRPRVPVKALPGVMTTARAVKAVAKNVTRRKAFVKKVRKEIKKEVKGKSMKTRLAKLEKKVSETLSFMTYRLIGSGQVVAAANAAAFSSLTYNDSSSIEAILAQLKYYDPSTPGTLVVASGATGTYDRKFKVKTKSALVLRNNCQIPIEVRVYTMRCVSDTSISATTNWDNCLTDSCNLAKENLCVYPSDAVGADRLWKMENCKIFKILPGKSRNWSIFLKEASYDPAVYDSTGLSYSHRWNTTQAVIRVRGVVAHDNTTTSTVAVAPAAVDFTEVKSYEVKYNSGGPKLVYTFGVNYLTTMAAGAVVSEAPIADNIAYSLS